MMINGKLSRARRRFLRITDGKRMSKKEKPDDRLGLARNLLLASWLVTGILLGLMLLDSSLRPSLQEESSYALGQGLLLSNLSIVPAGRPFRNPEALHDAVDLRFSPLLPLVGTEPAGLLLSEPGTPNDGFCR
jgi:hypothetical protein